jgi:hypothetical protein
MTDHKWHRLVELATDVRWRQSHWRNEWEALTKDEQDSAQLHMSHDLEMYMRSDDPMKGQSPRDYLEKEEAEQKQRAKNLLANGGRV